MNPAPSISPCQYSVENRLLKGYAVRAEKSAEEPEGYTFCARGMSGISYRIFFWSALLMSEYNGIMDNNLGYCYAGYKGTARARPTSLHTKGE